MEIPEEELYILCGCPADVVKHLMIRGFIVPKIKKGVSYETGPNAILLSDVSIQNGQFSNLAEFPILQMFYRQGMIIPNHPGNNGKKPILIGHPSQIAAQSEYIMRGNYGLSTEEIIASGVDPKMAEEIFRIKMKFAFGKMTKTEELLDYRPVETSAVEVRSGVLIRRRGLNIFDFIYQNENLTVNLNLTKSEEYKPAVNPDFHEIRKEYFSIIHIGEGDGWETSKPCMSSLITYQGNIYLIDTGPNILHSLTALGISINEIAGIFHTHAHDDHFAGLTSLVRSDHRIHYYATPLVRASVTKKLSSLMSISEQRFNNSFIIHDLNFDEWNNINGLEVMPVFSPHPVETSILFFRTFWESGYRTYAHLTDIPSLKVLDSLLLERTKESAAAKAMYEQSKMCFSTPADIKKIDIGGGMIHGDAEDFANDRSRKIFLSHTSRELTPEEKEIGSNASFGQTDVLIRSNKDYAMQAAYIYMQEYFPVAPVSDLNMLLNCPVVSFGVGEIILKKGDEPRHIFLILSGVAEYIDSEKKLSIRLSTGSFLGEMAALYHEASRRTYRTLSHVKVLQIPVEIYNHFIALNFNQEDLKQTFEMISFLQSTPLFGEMVPTPTQYWIAKKVSVKSFKSSEELTSGSEPGLILIKSGEAEIRAEGKRIDILKAGDFFGEEEFILGYSNIFKAFAVKPVEAVIIPASLLKGIPIIEWKIMENFEKLILGFGMQVG